jgi:hypothetical protein
MRVHPLGASPHTLRWGCAFARRDGFAPSASPVGGLPRGDLPWSIPRCLASPLPSSAFRAPPFDVRGSPRGPYDQGAPHANACERDPPDLDADFPVASRSLRPSLPAGLPLLGLSKDRPSIEPRRRVRRPGTASPRPLRGTTAGRSRVPPAWFCTTSAACSSPTVKVCCALLPILGFTVFLPVAKRASSRCVPALRSFPSADSGSPGSRRTRGLASRTVHCGTCPSPLAVPPHPSRRAP